MKIERHTVQWRLMEWGRWTQEPRRDFGRSSSPFGKIAEMHDNAGIHADGIRYEIISEGGETFSCPPDGGMSAEVERNAKALAFDIKCREIESAVSELSDAARRVVIATYVVPKRERVRSGRQAADKLGITQQAVHEHLENAHEKVSRRVYGAFHIAAPADLEIDDAA